MIFLKLKAKVFWNDFKRLSFGKSLKIFFFLFVGFVLVAGLYGGFYRLLGYLNTVPLIGKLLMIKMISMVFLWMFVMIIISSLISGFSTIYFSSDLHMLICSPLSAQKVFLWKGAETCVYSSWMILLAVMPFLAAYAAVNQLGISFYVVLLILLVPFLMTASSIGIICGTCLVGLFPHRRLRDALIVIIVLVGSGLYIGFRLMQPEALIRPDVFERVLQYVALIQAPTAVYLPSWWITAAIQSLTQNRWDEVVSYAVLLISIAVISVIVLRVLGETFFYRGWSGAQEKNLRKQQKMVSIKASLNGSPLLSIIKKDILVFFRDVNQWTQLLLLSALIVVYLFSIYKLPLDTRYLKSLVSFLNIGMIGFVLAAISLRFVFPAISLEGKNYWIMRASPVSAQKLMWTKFLYTFPVIMCIGFILVLVSNRLLSADKFVHLLGAGSIFLIALTLAGMGIGMGSSFPYFHIENIARIESSAGGILYMICSFFYVGLVLAFTAVPMRMYFFSHFRDTGASHYTVLLITWILLFGVSMIFFMVSFTHGRRRLFSYDV